MMAGQPPPCSEDRWGGKEDTVSEEKNSDKEGGEKRGILSTERAQKLGETREAADSTDNKDGDEDG